MLISMAKRSGSSATGSTPGPLTGSTEGDEVAEVASRMRLATARLHRTLRQSADSGLSPSQLSALVAIDRHGSMTLGELATHEAVAPPTITGVVARLEADGNVAREADPLDRRVVRVTATDQGREVVIRTRERKDAWLTQRIAGLDPEELERLAAALPVIEALAERNER